MVAMQIDKYKLKVYMFTAELPEPLDREKRCLVTTEVDITDVGTPSNNDGTYDEVYKAKVVGTTIVKQGGEKAPILAKSKRSQSKKLRQRIWQDDPDEEYYQKCTNAIISNWDDIRDYLIKEGKLYV